MDVKEIIAQCLEANYSSAGFADNGESDITARRVLEALDALGWKIVRVESANRLMEWPTDYSPAPYISGEKPDWHAGVLREVARMLGGGSDVYYPLLGAANKIEMFRCGASYAEAMTKEGRGEYDPLQRA